MAVRENMEDRKELLAPPLSKADMKASYTYHMCTPYFNCSCAGEDRYNRRELPLHQRVMTKLPKLSSLIKMKAAALHLTALSCMLSLCQKNSP